MRRAAEVGGTAGARNASDEPRALRLLAVLARGCRSALAADAEVRRVRPAGDRLAAAACALSWLSAGLTAAALAQLLHARSALRPAKAEAGLAAGLARGRGMAPAISARLRAFAVVGLPVRASTGARLLARAVAEIRQAALVAQALSVSLSERELPALPLVSCREPPLAFLYEPP